METTTEPNDGDELDALADLALEAELADDAEAVDDAAIADEAAAPAAGDAAATGDDAAIADEAAAPAAGDAAATGDDAAIADEAAAPAAGDAAATGDDAAIADEAAAPAAGDAAATGDDAAADAIGEASDEESRPSLVATLVEAARRSSGWRPVSRSFEAIAVVDGLGPQDDETDDDMVDRDFLGWAPAGCAVEPTWRSSFIESATRALRAEHLADDSPDRPDPTMLEELAGVIGRLEQQVPGLVVAAVVRFKDTLPLVSRSAGRGLHPAVAAAALAGMARSGQAAVEMMGGVELFGPTEMVSIHTADARCIIDHLDREHALVVVVDREHADEEAAVDQLLVELRPDWLAALATTSSSAA